VHDLTLSEDAYWRTDSTYLVSDDSFHKGNKAGRPSQMLKANRFICDVTFKPENTEGMSFLEIRENSQSTKGNSIHSQGGTFVVKREFDGKEFEYLMREKQYPFYAERPEFIYFSMREKGEPYSLSYNVVDLNSRRIGLQAGDFGYNCYREGYTFDESIEQLNKQ
jgi:hypothetical protein